ncbi:hypothetical protein BVRB_2g033150 [Beta vulgaris subsp. vulgaris]|uniref:Gnk2-homologous domain-containing protein n=1 Tax=Beta vulgaris subsp. vulgaris TaxID=3555 RepID=A0A0J8D0X1_BETVV|nr:hypothetical protein BVRB_2g033150 [Beta vulgaris subsp. vulgaris]
MAAWQIISPLLLLFATSLYLINPTTCLESPIFLGWKCDPKANYTENSPYHSNLLKAFSNLTSLSSFNTFSTFTAGSDDEATNKVYALYDCRNDLPLRICHDCVEDAAKNLVQLCSSKEAKVTYEECLLRYANRPIFAKMELEPYYRECQISIPDGGELNRTIEPIFRGLIDQATSKNSSRYFAMEQMSYFEYQKVDCLVQCTPDISREECKECLMDALNYTLECANSSLMLSYHLAPSCQMRYDVLQRFVNISSSPIPSSMASPPTLSPQLKTSDGSQCLISIEIFILVFFFFCLML